MAKIDRETLNCLDVIQEECAEVIQIISKIKRFGITDIYNGKTNLERFAGEMGDLVGTVRFLETLEPEWMDDKFYEICDSHFESKQAKVTKYFNEYTKVNEQE